jgi:hypothetical protein
MDVGIDLATEPGVQLAEAALDGLDLLLGHGPFPRLGLRKRLDCRRRDRGRSASCSQARAWAHSRLAVRGEERPKPFPLEAARRRCVGAGIHLILLPPHTKMGSLDCHDFAEFFLRCGTCHGD